MKFGLRLQPNRRPLPTFDEFQERAIVDGSEYFYGAIETDLAAVPVSVRLQYAPKGVLQYNNMMDTNGCSSRADLNVVEAKLDYFYEHGMHPAIQRWCNDNGYRPNGRFELCDAFIEILSGTTPQGNSLKTPIDTFYRYGAIPAALIPLKDDMTWEQYMNASRITQAHKDLAEAFNKRIKWNYEIVAATDFLTALQDDYLIVAGHGWSTPVNGVYPRTDAAFNHAFATANPEIDALDNYVPFTKRLAKNYKFFDWGYSLSITAQNPYPAETVALFDVLQKYGLLSFFAEAWKRLFDAPVAPATVVIDHTTPPEPEPPAPVPATPTIKLEDFCLQIRNFEGWFPTSRSFKNNNPGNCRYSTVGYDASYLPVLKDSKGFAVFKDYASGWRYLKNLVKLRISLHPDWTILDFLKVYAPSSDGNDPTHYAAVVAQKLGVTSAFKIKNISG
jgi:hypothetical protein